MSLFVEKFWRYIWNLLIIQIYVEGGLTFSMDTHDSILKFMKGSRTANTVLIESSRFMIKFSVELCVLSFLIMAYVGVFSVQCMITAGILAVSFIAGIILNQIYIRKRTKIVNIYSTVSVHDDKEKISQYCDDSMEVMKLGIVSAGINVFTVGVSIILLALVVFSIVSKWL